MDSFKVGEFVVIRVDTDAEEQASVATVYNLVVAELYRATLFIPILARWVGCKDAPRRSYSGTSGLSERLAGAPLPASEPASHRHCKPPTPCFSYVQALQTFSSSSYGTYHLDNRVLPWRFCHEGLDR